MTNKPNLPASKRSDEQIGECSKSAEEPVKEIEVGKDSPYLKLGDPEKKVELVGGIRI